MLKLNHTNYNDLTNIDRAATKVTLVKFWASWCQPCKVLTQKLEALVKEYPEGTVNVLEYEVDQSLEDTAFARSLGIGTVPTVIVIDNATNRRIMLGNDVGGLKAKINEFCGVEQ